MEKFDFTNPNHQKGFERLSKEEQEKIIAESHDEANELNEAHDDIVDMKIEYPIKWIDDEGMVHGAKTEAEAQLQKEEYRETKER